MSLTLDQQASIAEHLGYPYKQWVINYIQQRLLTIASLINATELETRIAEILTQLDNIDDLRSSSIGNTAGKQIEGGTGDAYFVGRVTSDYTREYNYFRNRLAVYMDMPVYDKLFPGGHSSPRLIVS